MNMKYKINIKMNKLSALDSYKVTVILDGVSFKSLTNPLLESREAILPGDVKVEHG